MRTSRAEVGARLFVKTAERQLGDSLTRSNPSPSLRMAYLLGGDRRKSIVSEQRTRLSSAVGQIITTFNPETVEFDEVRRSIFSNNTPHANIKAKGTGAGKNPLFDQGLPNAFVTKEAPDGNMTVHLQYIPNPWGWAAPVETSPPVRPSINFEQKDDGLFDIAGIYRGSIFSEVGIAGFSLKQAERMVAITTLIADRLCDAALRPELVVYTDK